MEIVEAVRLINGFKAVLGFFSERNVGKDKVMAILEAAGDEDVTEEVVSALIDEAQAGLDNFQDEINNREG